MKIKTLAEILNEEGSSHDHSLQKAPIKPKKHTRSSTSISKSVTNVKDNIYEQTIPIKGNAKLQQLTAELQQTLKTPEQKKAELDELKAEQRLRWLAFYYLSTREHSVNELRQKLLNKQQDPQKIEELLVEFAEKGYQSEFRTAFMLIREGIRKGRGRNRIKQDFYKRQLNLGMSIDIDELISIANEESNQLSEFTDTLDNNNEYVSNDQVDWLVLAVEARIRKYGDVVPQDAKDKAKQLRFLQYRGFTSSICFEAIKHNESSLAER